MQSADMSHEEETIKAFVVRRKRARYLGFVSNRKTRHKFTHQLAHFRDTTPSCRRDISPSRQSPRDIARILDAKGARGLCYVMSEHPEWDGKELPLSEALELVVGSGMGTIVSCIPGQLGFVETEDGRFIVERKRTPRKPPQCIRFVAMKTDPDSRSAQGIFQPAYRVRDDWEVPAHQREELRELLEWFDEHLPSPECLRGTRNKFALSWFKSESKECISRVWSLVQILEENGVVINKIKTGRPGHVLYEDQWQIVAIPHGILS
jgi:hypothetical protein